MDLEAETLHLFHVLNQEAADEVALRRDVIVQVLCLVVWQSWPKSNNCPPKCPKSTCSGLATALPHEEGKQLLSCMSSKKLSGCVRCCLKDSVVLYDTTLTNPDGCAGESLVWGREDVAGPGAPLL